MLWYFVTCHSLVVLDVPLLFESNLDRWVHKSLVVVVPAEVQMERLVKRSQYTADEARQRIEAQMPASERESRASYVIDNSGDMARTFEQVDAIIKQEMPSPF